MSESDAFHRYGDEYLTRADWGGNEPDRARRIALAIGPEPIENMRYLLPPVTLEAQSKPVLAPEGPDTATQFVTDVFLSRPISLIEAVAALPVDVRAEMDFPRVWTRAPGTSPEPTTPWFILHATPPEIPALGELPVGGVALAWPLTGLVSQGKEAGRDLAHYVAVADRAFAPLGGRAAPRETPDGAAARAARLIRIKERFAHAVEMRLMTQGKPFSARDVWRAAYALGLVWGDMDLFHWSDPVTKRRLFTMSGTGQPGYFLPERAAEGERLPGIALGFELPTAPAPLETYDRMAVALGYLRQTLGGRPATPTGAELDAERLEEERDALQESVDEMARAGIAPGSAEAARYF